MGKRFCERKTSAPCKVAFLGLAQRAACPAGTSLLSSDSAVEMLERPALVPLTGPG
jgi:hypothetical protein